MSDSIATFEPPEAPQRITGEVFGIEFKVPMILAKMSMAKSLQKIHGYNLQVTWPNGNAVSYGDSSAKKTGLHLKNDNPIKRTAMSGEIGFMESYLAWEWEPHNPQNLNSLPDLLEALIENRDVLSRQSSRLTRQQRENIRRHQERANTVEQSGSNIRSHYDIGNEFFSLFLGKTMSYSSAVDLNPAEPFDLDGSQMNKFRQIPQQLGLKRGDLLLNVGSGWIGLEECLAIEYGIRTISITRSQAQAQYANEAIREKGLEGMIEVREMDYRNLTELGYERFDGVMSMEMLEAVGSQRLSGEAQTPYEQFFQQAFNVAKPGARIFNQTIESKDDVLDKPSELRGVNFIGMYIFPGGELPTQRELYNAALKAGFVKAENGVRNLTKDYERTLGEWRKRLFERIDDVKAYIIKNHIDTREISTAQIEGKAETFVRMWDLYLASCQAGFRTGITGDYQRVMAKPE